MALAQVSGHPQLGEPLLCALALGFTTETPNDTPEHTHSREKTHPKQLH